MPGVIPSLAVLKRQNRVVSKRLKTGEPIDPNFVLLSQLNSGNSRMVDTYSYDYVKLVRDTTEPFAKVTNKKVRVAIIGAGYAGATSAYELRRAGVEDITVYEAREKIGGRADSREFKDDQGRSYINEMGPMRLPENSKLFWHYFSKIVPKEQGKNPKQKIFPNPGVVATEIVYRGLRYTWIGGEAPQPTDPNNPNNVDWGKMRNDIFEFIGSLKFEEDSVDDIAKLLQEKSLTLKDKKRINKYWSYFLKKYDEVSFVAAIEEYFGDRWGPTEYNMFATLGLGTGGFGPLYPVCFLEIFRLFLWEYVNEYSPSLPMTEIVKRLVSTNPKTGKEDEKVKVCYEAVDYVGVNKENPDQIDVFSIVPGRKRNRVRKDSFDYVIVATTLRSMQIRMNLDAETSPKRYALEVDPVFSGSPNNMVRESMRVPHIMNSSKLFGFLPAKPWIKDSKIWPQYEGNPIKCVLTDTLARQMYYLDPYDKDDKAGSNVLISYNWGDDSIKIMGIQDYKPNQVVDPRGDKNFTLKEAYETGLETMIADSTAAKSLRQIKVKDQERFLTSVIWQREPMIFGAFKIDLPQQYYYTSQMVYQYHYANRRDQPGVSKRVYLAGNNVSYQGGWIEGALQSAVNAVSAVLKEMQRNKEAKDFRMQGLFRPNPFGPVLKEFKERYSLRPLPVDLLMDKRKKKGKGGLSKKVEVSDR